jgi:hypothetical protein
MVYPPKNYQYFPIIPGKFMGVNLSKKGRKNKKWVPGELLRKGF